uniref:Uncharacterized protein n=1 Tax=Oryza punctata TaxID=4537 RepID=A0A0E0LWJ2_ORYPU
MKRVQPSSVAAQGGRPSRRVDLDLGILRLGGEMVAILAMAALAATGGVDPGACNILPTFTGAFTRESVRRKGVLRGTDGLAEMWQQVCVSRYIPGNRDLEHFDGAITEEQLGWLMRAIAERRVTDTDPSQEFPSRGRRLERRGGRGADPIGAQPAGARRGSSARFDSPADGLYAAARFNAGTATAPL